MTERLNRRDWIDEALRTLRRNGADAVRVEALAKTLGVTKGSFYWHFRDRSALLRAALEAWRERTTEAIIAHFDAIGGDARSRLAGLCRLTVQSDGRLERAIRSWAATDEMARAVLAGVDDRRIGYLQSLFEEMGFASGEALSRSRLIYLALIGQHMIRDDQPSWLMESLDDLIAVITQPMRPLNAGTVMRRPNGIR